MLKICSKSCFGVIVLLDSSAKDIASLPQTDLVVCLDIFETKSIGRKLTSSFVMNMKYQSRELM